MCRDYLSFSYYPVWNGLLDLFATDNDVYMHSLTRLQWVNNIVYDIENNLISSDVSVNTYSALVSLGETQLASLILDALKERISPASYRAFLSPIHCKKEERPLLQLTIIIKQEMKRN